LIKTRKREEIREGRRNRERRITPHNLSFINFSCEVQGVFFST